jgi:hypothetical protein
MSTFLDADLALAQRAIRASGSASPSSSAASSGFANSGLDDLTFDDTALIQVPISQNAAGTWPLISGQSGSRIAIHALFLWFNAINDIALLNGIVPLMTMPGVPAAFSLGWAISVHPHFLLDIGSSFQIQMSTASGLSGYARYKLM